MKEMYIEERLEKLEKKLTELKEWLENIVNQGPVSNQAPEAITEAEVVTEPEVEKPKRGRKPKQATEPVAEEPKEDIIDDIFDMQAEVKQMTIEEFALLVRQAIDSPKGGKSNVIKILSKYGYKGGKLSEGFPQDKCGICAKELETLL